MSDPSDSVFGFSLLHVVAEAFSDLLNAERNGTVAAEMDLILTKYQGQIRVLHERLEAFCKKQEAFDHELRKAAHELVPPDSLQNLVFHRLRPWFITQEPNWAQAIFCRAKDGRCIGFVTGPMYGTVRFPPELLDSLELEFIFLGARLTGEISGQAPMLQVKNPAHQVQLLPDRTLLDSEGMSWVAKEVHGRKFLLSVPNKKDAGEPYLERRGYLDDARNSATDVFYFPLHLNADKVVSLNELLGG